jgi:hypothetical protein
VNGYRLLPPQGDSTIDPFGRGVLVGSVELTIHVGNPRDLDLKVGVGLADGEFSADTIVVRGRVVTSVQASPSELVLPRASAGGAIYEATCLCRSTVGKPITIAVVEASDGLSATVPDTPSFVPLVVVKYHHTQPHLPTQPPTGAVKLLSKWDGGEQEVVITVSLADQSWK